MKPRDFVNTFGDLTYSAQVVYQGTLNKEFIQNVREGLYPVVEGVVAKGDNFMVKIKTNEYLDKLKKVFSGNWNQYWE